MEHNSIDSWKQTKFVNPNDPTDNQLIRRKTTSLQQLRLRYSRFSLIALLMIFWCPLFAFSQPFFPYKPYIAVAFGIFFLICSAMDYWLSHGIGSIDCATMSVVEVARLAAFYRKRHLQFQMILIPFAAAIITAIILLASGNSYFIYGIIFGLILGVAIGLRFFIRFMRDYKNLIGMFLIPLLPSLLSLQ